MRPDLDGLLDFAARTVARAGEITHGLFCNSVVEYKGDGSEVTAADRAAEAYIHSAIQEAFPEDGLLGEEGADLPSRSGRRWVVDPVDGTRSFAAGVPLYTVLLALEENGVPLLGCCHVPATGETLVAATGAGAWLNGRAARVSGCETVQDARVVTSGWEYWRDYGDAPMRAGWDQLVSRSRWARTWGDGFGYLLVATGRVDLLADPITGNPWDFTPFLPIFKEAGARFTTFDGKPISAWSTALAANPRLHAAASECWAQ